MERSISIFDCLIPTNIGRVIFDVSRIIIFYRVYVEKIVPLIEGFVLWTEGQESEMQWWNREWVFEAKKGVFRRARKGPFGPVDG